MRLRRHPRSGTSMIELAVVGPVVFLLLLGLLIGGYGIFRYQQIARLARDGSRWASVRGTQYAHDTGNTAATAQDVHDQVIAPNAAGFDLSKLTSSVTWNSSNSPYHMATVNGSNVQVANTVTVTVTYQWIPEAFLGGMTI